MPPRRSRPGKRSGVSITVDTSKFSRAVKRRIAQASGKELRRALFIGATKIQESELQASGVGGQARKRTYVRALDSKETTATVRLYPRWYLRFRERGTGPSIQPRKKRVLYWAGARHPVRRTGGQRRRPYWTAGILLGKKPALKAVERALFKRR